MSQHDELIVLLCQAVDALEESFQVAAKIEGTKGGKRLQDAVGSARLQTYEAINATRMRAFFMAEAAAIVVAPIRP